MDGVPLIGVMDSGLGGVSVLNELFQTFPEANYIYFGDLANSPYGSKPKEIVLEYVRDICNFFVSQQVNAILLACNTATSAAVHILREEYSIPIFGMEPAVKPAFLSNPFDKIAVLATSLTLQEKKFHDLLNSLNAEQRVIRIKCDGLASMIDQKDNVGIDNFLHSIQRKLEEYSSNVIVLGCTHYVLIKEKFQKALPKVKIYDGNHGTALHIKNSFQNWIKTVHSKIIICLNGGEDKDYLLCQSYLKIPKHIEVKLCKINQLTKMQA